MSERTTGGGRSAGPAGAAGTTGTAGAPAEVGPDADDDPMARAGLLGGVAGDLLAFAVALAIAFAIVWLGGFVAHLVDADDRWGVIGALALYLYLQVKHTTRLRLENRRLRALELLVAAAGRKA